MTQAIKMNKKLVSEWVKDVGGVHKATSKIIERTKLRASTAEKIAECRYPYLPGALVREALADLIGASEEELFTVKNDEAS